ncbi:MAG TPA: tetratricopeptide repeat protein [Bacteroidia bacterium]|jgi:serine phosphatase RsbU (regulator of sigma subunit)|nr:tetratricopeptide repeat protein [Bacteroidia bacterium]
MKNMKRLLTLFSVLVFSAMSAGNADSLVALLNGKQDTQQVNLLVRISKAYDDQGDSLGITYAQQAISMAEKIGYIKGSAMGNAAKGLAEESAQNFTLSIACQQRANELYAQINDTLGQAKALGNMANNEYYIGDYSSAAEHAFAALKLYEAINYYMGMFASHLAIGNVMLDQKLYGGALGQYKEVLELSKRFPENPTMRARALANIGNVYNLRGLNDSAIYFYSTADTIFEKAKANYEISVCLNNLGTIMQNQKKYEQAQILFRRSLALRRMIGDSDGVSSALQNLASSSNELGKYDSAYYYYHRSLDIANASASRSQQLSCYHGLSITFANLKQFDSAYYYLDRYTTLNDSLTGEESLNTMNTLRSHYDAEKQQHQLDVLESQRQAEQAESSRNIVLLCVGILLLLLVIGIIVYRSRTKQKHSRALEMHNAEITLQKKHITDSINYAKKIQDSILPPEHLVQNILPDSFILYEPKDVVSGDFYWVEKRDNISIFSAVDCTGHGVPGALMSVVGFNLLTQAVNEKGITKPSDILHHLDFGVNKLLRQSDKGSVVKDGMDLGLVALNMKTNEMQFAGAFNPVYIIQDGELKEIKADKFPIGINTDGVTDEYTNHVVQMKKGDMIYLLSDGYADQFGGPHGKKFKYNRLRELLKQIWQLPLHEQKKALRDAFLNWKAGHEQVDDILVIGVRV